jgi:hypothetical protein
MPRKLISKGMTNPGTGSRLRVTTQVFRLKAEGSKLSRKARIEPFKTFSEFCMITHDFPLKAFSLQPIYLSSYAV